MSWGANNEEGLRNMLNKLSPKARPKNGAWRRLEAVGFEPDYCDSDAGEPPKGEEW